MVSDIRADGSLLLIRFSESRRCAPDRRRPWLGANGFSVRDLAAITDFVGPHFYRMENDVVRQHLAAAFVCELAGSLTGQLQRLLIARALLLDSSCWWPPR